MTDLDEPVSLDLLKVRMDLYNLQHFLMTTPLGYKRELVDAELRKLWERWDALDARRPA